METDRFQLAAAIAAKSYPDGVWERLSIAQQCAAIYAELRRLDALSYPREITKQKNSRPAVTRRGGRVSAHKGKSALA